MSDEQNQILRSPQINSVDINSVDISSIDINEINIQPIDINPIYNDDVMDTQLDNNLILDNTHEDDAEFIECIIKDHQIIDKTLTISYVTEPYDNTINDNLDECYMCYDKLVKNVVNINNNECDCFVNIILCDSCFFDWFIKSNKCPICRKTFRSNPDNQFELYRFISRFLLVKLINKMCSYLSFNKKFNIHNDIDIPYSIEQNAYPTMKRRVKSADSFNNLYYDVESVGNMNIDRENDDDLPIFSIDGQLLRSPNFSRTDTTINQDLIVNENIEQTETNNRNRCLDYCYLTKTEAFIISILSSILFTIIYFGMLIMFNK